MNNEEVLVQGFVIKSVEYKESDAIITCLTSGGIFSFKARGVLKPGSKNAASCLLYAYSEFVLQEKDNYYFLTKGKLLSSNFKLYDSIDNMCILGLISESILNFLDKPSPIIYNMFQRLIQGINQQFDILTLAVLSLAKIIVESGYGLITNQCVRCGKKTRIVSIDYSDGGFICLDCINDKKDVDSPEYLKSIRYSFMVDCDDFFHHEFKKEIAIRLIKEYMNYLLDQFGYRKVNFYDLFNNLY